MPETRPTDLITCFYEDCVPLFYRRRAYVSARPDVVSAAGELWRYRDYHANPRCSTVEVPRGPLPFSSEWESIRKASTDVAKKHGISARRLQEFIRLAGVTYRSQRGTGLAGKLFEVIFYTRYRPRRHASMNEVFSLRVFAPAPLSFSCGNSIAAFTKSQDVVKHVLLFLLRYIIFAMGVPIRLTPCKVSPSCPNYFNLAEMPLREVPRPPLAQSLEDIIEYGFGESSIEEDASQLEASLPLYVPSEAARDFVSEFIEELPQNEVRVGCSENPMELYGALEGLTPESTACLERGALSGRCSDAQSCFFNNYCRFMKDRYYVCEGQKAIIHFRDYAKSAGYIVTPTGDTGDVEMPTWFWANGYFKVPLTTPAVAIVERTRFSDTAITAEVEANYSAFFTNPRSVAKEMAKQVLSPWAPPTSELFKTFPFQTTAFQLGVIPMTFYDLLSWVWWSK